MIELARASCGARTTPHSGRCSRHASYPGAAAEQLKWFNDLCLQTTTGEVVAALLEARAAVDVSELLAAVRVPYPGPACEERRGDSRSGGPPPGQRHSRARSTSNWTPVITSCCRTKPAWHRFREAVLVVRAARSAWPRVSAFETLSATGTPGAGTHRRTGSATGTSPLAWKSARRRSATMPPTCSTSSESGRGPRPSCSHAIEASGADDLGAILDVTTRPAQVNICDG